MTFRDDPAAYMRERYARMKAGTWPTTPKDAPKFRRQPRPIQNGETAEEYHARIGDGYFVDDRFVPFARPSPTPPTSVQTVRPPPPPSSASPRAPRAPPPSMSAIGGRPGRGLVPMGRGYPAPPDLAARQFDRYERMLEALARHSDEQARELRGQRGEIDAIKSRLAEIEQSRNGGFSSFISSLAVAFAHAARNYKSED